MDVEKAIKFRRSYRALDPVDPDKIDALIEDLAINASLAPSCYNNQPWRFVFVKSKEKLEQLFEALPKGNSWAKRSNLIIAVYSKEDWDCSVANRKYFLFDVGLAVAFMMLRATELNLVMHAIAGYDEALAKKVLNIPEDTTLITLLIVGKRSQNLALLPEHQQEHELKRPARKPFNEIAKVL